MSFIARPTTDVPCSFLRNAEATAPMASSAQHGFVEGQDVLIGVKDAAVPELLLVDEAVFRIVRRIMRGGMSGTYEAVLVGAKGALPADFLGRRVAIKVADSSRYAVNEWGHLREFRNMSVLPEPYAFGSVRSSGDDVSSRDREEDDGMGGRRAIVMEFIEGLDMAVWAQGWERDHGAPPPLEVVLDAMNPVLDFLKVASTARPPFVHRDIKPENLIVQQAKTGLRCRLIDLGISERTTPDGRIATNIGTRGFAAPEVLDVRPCASADDPRVDTFGIAATLYSVLSGGVYEYAWHGGFPVAHDEGLRRSLTESLLSSLPEKMGVEVTAESVEMAVEEAFRAIDAGVMESLRVGLSDKQEERPSPGAFADGLPRLRIESLLELHAASAYPRFLRQGRKGRFGRDADSMFVDSGLDVQESTLSDSVRYDGFEADFVCAMDAWNRGRYHEAVPLLRKLADAGDATSQYNLGICIRDGLGGAEGSPEEVIWRWTKAADEGHIVAMYNIGLCLERGWGVPDGGGGLAAAMRWYRRAADEGFPLATERLSELEAV